MKNSTLSFNHKRGVSSDTLWRKSYQTILSVLLGLALIFGTTLQLTAQVTAYTWSQSSGTYTAITGTQVLAAGSDDLSSATQTLPFTFTFDGQAQTTYVANSNGNIRFGGVAPTAQYSPISTTSNTNSISPFGRDGRTGGAVVSTVQGATPNRVFIIQYPNWNPAYFSAATTLDFQIRLYETTNVVEVVYGASVRTASYTGEVGIRGNLAVASNFNNRTTASNWASATSGIATSMITLSTTVFPASGLTYTWTPPACASSANSSFDEVITNVSLGSLNNTTVCGITAPGAGSIANQYGNYTTLTAPNLNIGVSYPASVSVGTCGGYYGTFTNTYIDWNGDQDFLDAGETVYTSLSTPGAATLTYNVLVPAGTVPGLKRMRIVHVESAAPSSCGTYFYGETEDYNVNIVAAPACLAPTLSTVAATCSSPGTATVSNYDATSTYVSTPAGATVGALGVITATAGTAYTLTAANATCGALVASASFTIDVQLTEPVAPAVTTTVATCTSPGTATVSNYDSTSTYVSTPVGATVGALGVITATAGTAYTLTAANATCTSVASASFTNDVQLPEPVAPSVTTTAASCTSPGTATVSNYDSTSIYVSTPVGATVGVLGVITATSGTAYTLTAANATCTSVASVSVTIAVQLAAPVAVATDNGDATLTATAGTGYVWIDCATNTAIAGATAQTFAPTVNGNYAVVLTNAAGCSDTSVCVTIANIGIKEIAGTGVSIYPNPTSSDVVINFPSNSASIEVMDATGKVVSTSTITTGGKVTLADFNRGIYYIRLNTENATSIHKVIKN